MVYVNIHPHQRAHLREIHELPKGAQALGFDFGWVEQLDIGGEGGGSTSVFFIPWRLPRCLVIRFTALHSYGGGGS